MTERNYGVVKLHSSEEIGADCPDCGALVWNEAKHNAFHDSLDMLMANVCFEPDPQKKLPCTKIKGHTGPHYNAW